MNTPDRIRGLIERIDELGLKGIGFLSRFDLETIRREYNGIGPEFFEPELREKITKFLSIFEPPAVLHDMRNFMSDGTKDAFHYANWEFFQNCRKCADAAYPWWNWKRYRARAVAKILFDFVDGTPGWRAWMDCYEKNKNKE